MDQKHIKKKGSGRNFQKGNTYGKGRPRIPEVVKEFRKMTISQVTEIFSKFTDMTIEELQKYIVNKNNPDSLKMHWMESYIASMIIKGVSTGDGSNLNLLLDRIIGKPKTVIEATVIDENKKARLDHSLNILKSILEERKSNNTDEYFNAGLLNEFKK